MVKGLLFDKDGTLFDFARTWGAWTEATIRAESRGDAGLADRMAAVLGYDRTTGRFERSSIVIAHTTAEVAAALAPVLGEDPGRLVQRLDALAREAPQVEAAPLAEVLGALHARGLKLGVATNDSASSAQAHVAHVADQLDFVAGYDSGFGAKPAPGMCLAFADAVGLAPGDCAMVGDSLHDLHAGAAAGMVRVAVLTGIATRDDLAPHADVVLDSIAELPAWLDARG